MNNSKIKVAFITYSLSGGGAEKNIILLKRYLRKVHIHADIITFKDINEYKDEYPKIRAIPLTNFKTKIPALFLPFYILLGIGRLFFLIKKNKYTILFGIPHHLPYYVAVLYAKLFRIKSALIIVNNIPLELRKLSWILRVVHRYLLKHVFYQCDSIICKSYGLLALVPKNKATVIPNGVDIPYIATQMKKQLPRKYVSLFEKNKIILTAGRLEEQKNYVSLITLFKAIKTFPNTENIKLCILGKGSLLQYLQKHVSQLELHNDVFFLGHEFRNIYRYMYRSKLFILSSSYEGFGNVIIESLACRLPVLSTDCQYGPREILCGNKSYLKNTTRNIQYCDYGMLISPSFEKKGATEKIARNIYRLLRDRTRLNAYKKVSKKRIGEYSIDDVGKQYLNLILNT